MSRSGLAQRAIEQVYQFAPVPLGGLSVEAAEPGEVGLGVTVGRADVHLSAITHASRVEGLVEALDLLGRQRLVLIRVAEVQFGGNGSGQQVRAVGRVDGQETAVESGAGRDPVWIRCRRCAT
jgi:hypothetical protein